jgi:arabinan endo-1,5-alpha-L-arabinosidase
MMAENGTYYVFSTGTPGVGGGNVQMRASRNLTTWTYLGTMFPAIAAWAKRLIPGATSVWAPDVSYYHGYYQVYYAVSTFGSNRSVIGLALNKTLNPKAPDYRWIDAGRVLASTPADDWNAIDPNFVLDAQGHPWLVFGSFWSGIKMVALDPRTRKPYGPTPKIYALAERPTPPDAIEGAFLTYHKPYYYLFASFGFCCRGVNSTYNIRVGRSRRVTGPYVDKVGTSMLNGGGTMLLETEGAMIGPGGQSVPRVAGQYYLVYHYYDWYLNGAARLQIRKLSWADGWPALGPPIVPIPGALHAAFTTSRP